MASKGGSSGGSKSGGSSGGSKGGGGKSSGGGKSGGSKSGGGSSKGGGGKGGGGPVMRQDAHCPSFVGARVIRLTRLNACGAPMFGPGNVATTKGVTTVTLEPQTSDGDSIDSKNINGEQCVSAKTPSSMTGIKVSLEFCQIDPAVLSIINPNLKTVRHSRDDYSGDITGFRLGQQISSDDFGFALELWPKTSGLNNACTAGEGMDPSDPRTVSGYFLLPYIKADGIDQMEIKPDEVMSLKLSGTTAGGGGWDVGPYVVTRDEAEAPSPLLRPIEDGSGKGNFHNPASGQPNKDPDHFHAEVVSVAPPPDACGPQNLIKPRVAFHQDGTHTRVTLLNPDEVAPADPNTGIRPPVWVSWGDGTPRANLTDPHNMHPPDPEDEDDGEHGPDPDGPDDHPQDPNGGGAGQPPNVELHQDPHDPRRVTAEGSDLHEPVTVDWGQDVQAPKQPGQEPVRVTQDGHDPRRVTADLQDGQQATVDWGQDVSGPGQSQQPPHPVQQDPSNPRQVTAHLPHGQQQAAVNWGQDVQEQNQ